MTTIELWSLITSSFTAIGTCSATILALYFWFYDNKIKLNIRAFHGESYGSFPKIEGGYFLVSLTNTSNWTIRLESAGLKAYRSRFLFKVFSNFMIFENNSHDALPKKLEYGETYNYVVSMNEMINRFEQFNERNDIVDLKAFACVSTARGDLNFNLSKLLKSKLIKNT